MSKSRPERDSSNIIKSGDDARTLAIDNLCFSPPESCEGKKFKYSVSSPTNCNSSKEEKGELFTLITSLIILLILIFGLKEE